MNNLETAKQYMEIFYSGKNLNRLRNLFCDKLYFEGPFFQFTSANDYINSLEVSPPVNFKYKILHCYEDKNSVCLIYSFTKADISTNMMQRFVFKNGKISEILLIFDTSDFK